MNSIQLLGQPRFLRGAAMYYVTSFDSAMSYLASDEFRTNVKQSVEGYHAELEAAANVAAAIADGDGDGKDDDDDNTE